MTAKATDQDGAKPEPYKAVRVWLSNGSRVHGMWTGAKWWSKEGEIFPERWEFEERPKKSKKIARTLPEELANPAS